MSKSKFFMIASLGLLAVGAQAQTPAKELVNKPITQLECGQDVDVHGPYSVVASKFGYNTSGAIQLFYNDQFIRQYKHDSYQNGDDLGKPETVALGDNGLVIGAPFYKNVNTGQQVGRVEVFKKMTDGSHYATYVTQAFSEGSTDVLTEFGKAVDIHGDWIAVGAPKKGTEGGVKVFQRSSTGLWVNKGWITLPDFQNAPYRYDFPGATYSNPALFGSDVAIMNNRLIVGAPGVGSFYIYEFINASWVLKGEYKGTKVFGMGSDVTITDNHALGSASGQAAVYEKHWDGTWRALQTITINGTIDDIAAENRHMVMGRANGGTDGNGIVDYYELRSHMVNGQSVYDFVLIGKMHVDVAASSKGLKNHKRLGYSVAIQGDVVVAGAPNAMYESVADGAGFRAPFHQMKTVSGLARMADASEEAFESNVAEASFSVYPNPASSTINFSSTSKVTGVSIFNAAGLEKTLYVEDNQVNVSELPSGLYIMAITTEGGLHTEKIEIR